MSENETSHSFTIDVVSDVMCPWCYIGKRRLDDALSRLGGDVPVEVRWRPYQLDPTLPKEGKDRRKYLEDKFGGSEAAERAYANVKTAGAEENIPFQFEEIGVSANTLDAHRLIRWAGSQGTDIQGKVVAILFRMYFEDGRNIGDDAVLIEAAAEAGLDPEIVKNLLESDADRDAVTQEIAVSQQMGVSGVPCFILDGKYAVMGAQSADVLANAIRQVAAETQTGGMGSAASA
ncbi:MAG: disulfide bond formation protein DsbA [Rhizobiales bacterium]|nr:disulfide bond formation protein DsbA [Hyphomicrobiales bacterium]MBA70426.1 disulfide bond formation protein DsbA [Hyphomicrobiales bacterium]